MPMRFRSNGAWKGPVGPPDPPHLAAARICLRPYARRCRPIPWAPLPARNAPTAGGRRTAHAPDQLGGTRLYFSALTEAVLKFRRRRRMCAARWML